MIVREWSPRLQAYRWVEREENEQKYESAYCLKYAGCTYQGAHSSMNKIYDSVRDYYNSRDWN